MITINLTDIYFCLCKLSATIFIISAATFGLLMLVMLAGVDIENDEDRWSSFATIVTTAGVASFALLIILLLALVIYEIWKL